MEEKSNISLVIYSINPAAGIIHHSFLTVSDKFILLTTLSSARSKQRIPNPSLNLFLQLGAPLDADSY